MRNIPGQKIKKLVLCVLLIICMILPTSVYAREGDCGYEGGISSGEAPSAISFEYQEPVFVSGEPIIFKGTLAIKKSLKAEVSTSTYTYNLKNLDKGATLTRVLIYNTKMTKKDNGQIIEETTLGGVPSESIKIGGNVYTLKSYNFTRSNLIDVKPAINYFAGNTWGRKTYQIGAATTGASVTVDITSNFYGYDEYWGTTEVQIFNFVIQSEQKKGESVDKWGGTASVSLSSTTTKKIRYIENIPDQMSFSGGYVQTQSNSSIAEYSCKLPEFDKDGVSTDNLIDTKDSLSIETFPTETRLPVPNLSQLRGHWAENNIKALFSLEVIKGNDWNFSPEKFMTRIEFAAAIVQAAKEVPPDPALAGKTPTPKPGITAKQTKVSPFVDVSVDNMYFSQVESAFKRGLMSGKGANTFAPYDKLTVADALTVFIRALGLERLAPNPGAVTTFRDNDQIPVYARDAAYVAEKIGLIQGDEKGFLRPKEYLTNARAAALLDRFINYMRDGIRYDYRDRIVNF